MTKSTITRERLEKIKSWRETYGAGSNVMLPAEEAEELARMALAAMDSEPVAIIDQANLDYLRSGADADVWPPEREEMGDVLLYRHTQPAPVVPELRLDWQENEFSAGWNACRAAMLAAAPQSAGSEPATVPGKWIPVSEQMPEVGVKVLCFPVEDEPIHAVFNGQLWLQDISWSNSDEPIDNVITCNITHWMQLPAVPQEVK
ncbi:TPA: DUF551 domain-containing protein [Klebsiella pneumoniae]|nr:DUF551 domain-containing protein [Klebsiella pneumoniae]